MSLRNYVLNFNDITKIGLTNLSFIIFKKVSDDVSVIAPTISELSLGFYKFSFDIDLINDDIYYVADDNSGNILTGQIALNSSDSLSNKMNRVLGLVQENQFIDQATYDLNNSLLTARLRTYSDSVDVGTNNNVLNTYLIDSTYTGTVLSTYSCKLVS